MVKTPKIDWKYDGTFASKLRRCRMEMGLTQREMALKIGVSQSHYAQMELGNAVLKDRKKLKVLAEVLGVHYDRILQDTEILIQDTTYLKTHYPHILFLLQSAIKKMSTIELIRSVDLIEKRIPYFKEDHSKLADNVRLFLLRKLGLHDEPENGLRPLAHYLLPLSKTVEEWDQRDSNAEDPQSNCLKYGKLVNANCMVAEPSRVKYLRSKKLEDRVKE